MQPSRPFWIDNTMIPNEAKFRPATQAIPTHCNVVIIGGGLTGTSLAYWLSKKNVKDVIVVEARHIAGGASGMNGGHLWPSLSVAIARDAQQASRMMEFELQTAASMQELIQERNIECDLKWTGAMSVASTDQEAEEMKLFAQQMTKDSVTREEFKWISASECAKLAHLDTAHCKGAILHKTAAQLWPAKFVMQTASIAERMGARFYTQTKVLRTHETTSYVDVVTDRGTVRCNHAVLCANGWTPEIEPALRGIIVPTRGQCIMTAPLPIRIPVSMSWNDSGEYLIQRQDGRVVLGGQRRMTHTKEVNTTDDSVISAEISKLLPQFLKNQFPAVRNMNPPLKIDREWTGIMGFSVDSNPLIGSLTNRKFISTAYTGHGMPRCFGAAKVIAEMIVGERKRNDFIEAFSPSRFEAVKKLQTQYPPTEIARAKL